MKHETALRAIVATHTADLAAAIQLLVNAPGLIEQRSAQGVLGGVVRRISSAARVLLAKKMLSEMRIETTQTVAKRVMLKTFGVATNTKELTEHFAKTGRKADEKLVEPALLTLQQNAELAQAYRATYIDFLQQVKTRISSLKEAAS